MIGTTASSLAGRCVRLAVRRSSARVAARSISFSAVRMHGGHDHDHDHDDQDFVALGKKPTSVPVTHASAGLHAHGHAHDHAHDHDHGHEHDHDHDSDEDSDDEDMVDTVALGPSGVEYGGPQRGGQFKEPTRFGDWERKGRCTDF